MPPSYWTQSLPAIHADTLIVGSGIVGLAAALDLQRRGQQPLILERATLAAGASSRNAGFLMRGAADNYAAAVATFGRDAARSLWRWTEDNLTQLRAEGIESLTSYRAVPSCLLAYDQTECDQLHRSLSMMGDDGFETAWVGSGNDSAWRSPMRPLGGLINPHDAAVNPAEMMRFLASKLSEPIHEGCDALSIEPSQTQTRDDGDAPTGDSNKAPGTKGRSAATTTVRLLSPRGVFTARRILICTNAYIGSLLPGLAPLVTPRRGQMLALRLPSARLDASYYANHGYEYFRQAADGTIVVGGCREQFADDEVGANDHPTPQVQHALEAFAERLFAVPRAQLNIIARWAGTMGFTPDGLPLIGAVPGPWPADSVWFCGGCTGHGLSMGWKLARAAVASMLDGSPNPFPLSRLHEPLAAKTRR